MPEKKVVVLGTQNRDKLRELQKLLKGTGIRALSLAGFPHCPKVKEDGRTFEANARKKARVYSRHTGLLTLADDSGLTVSCLRGKPGVYSARFAGPGRTYGDNNQKLLRLLRGVPASRRHAKFVCAVALYEGGRFVGSVKGECRGRVASAPRGKNGFGYDPVFVPRGFSKTFAELKPRDKNRVSHRGRALERAKRLLLAHWVKD